MAKIYVSPETLKKLTKSDNYSKMLNRFDINRPEPKKRQPKLSSHKLTNISPKSNRLESSLDTTFQKTIRKVAAEEFESYSTNILKLLKNNSEQSHRQKAQESKRDDSLQKSFNNLKKTLRRIKQRNHIELHKPKNAPKKKKKSPTKPLMGDISKHQHSRVINQPVTFFYTPRKSNSKPSSSNSSGKKTSVSSKYMFDYSSPANEYESRQVEFGHGRAKSKEWNDEIAKEFQKELTEARRHKPDWTDRFALK